MVWLRNYRYHHHHPPYHPLPNSHNPVADRFVRFHFASGESSASPVVCLWTECVCGWMGGKIVCSFHSSQIRAEPTHTHSHPLGGTKKIHRSVSILHQTMTDRRVRFRSQSALNLSSPIETAPNILIQMTPDLPLLPLSALALLTTGANNTCARSNRMEVKVKIRLVF